MNVALLRTLGDDEYRPVSRIPVRSKFFLATRLGQREEWFTGGEATLEKLDELFAQRNRLVHAQPEQGTVTSPFADPQRPDRHTDLGNIGRWISATVDAVSRLGRSHAELSGFDRVAGRLAEHAPMLWRFNADRDGADLDRIVRRVMRDLLHEDERDFLDFLNEDDLEALLDEQDRDWDVRGLDAV